MDLDWRHESDILLKTHAFLDITVEIKAIMSDVSRGETVTMFADGPTPRKRGERSMRRVVLIAIFSAATLMCVGLRTSAAEVLISEEEAKLPSSPPEYGINTRGPARGPAVDQLSPDPADQNVNSPLPLKIKFSRRNNVAINMASVKITYLKSPLVDLTDRIKPYLTEDGIEMKQAEVPPGTHFLLLNLRDAQGRVTSATIKLSVAPK